LKSHKDKYSESGFCVIQLESKYSNICSHSVAGLFFTRTSIFFTLTHGSVSVDEHRNLRI